MTYFAITAVELDQDGEIVRGKVHRIVGGNQNVPEFEDRFKILDRVKLVDLAGDDEVFALRDSDGQTLPPHRVRIRRSLDAIEHIESVDEKGQVSDALARLPRLTSG